MSFHPCRREVIGLGAGLAAASVLAACGGSSAPEPEQGAVLADASEVPEGEAIPVLIGDVPVILAHTPGGEFRAFSAICPHQGCNVLPPSQDDPETLECPCHRSRFETYTGTVLNGPADEDLTEIPVRVEDGKVVTA